MSLSPRIDYSDISRKCWRSDHDHARIINAARETAHDKHGDHSIEAVPADDLTFLAILMEEVGEVAHALTYDADPRALAGELVDVLAVASAWLDACRTSGRGPDLRKFGSPWMVGAWPNPLPDMVDQR